MKLTPGREARVRRAKVGELVHRPPELGPYAEALSLIPEVREKIKRDFNTPGIWFPGSLSAWSDTKWLDPSFDIPEISSEQIKEKLFTYIEDSEKHLDQGDGEAKTYMRTVWILEWASRAITIRHELRVDIVRRVQPHIDEALNRLEHMEYPTDSGGARDLATLLIRLHTFGPEVRERIKPLIKKFASSAVTLLQQMAEKEITTVEERTELLVNAGLLRLVHPDHQTEIQSIALPKVGNFDELSADPSDRFIVLLLQLLLHSPKLTLLPSGNLDMTLPPEAVTPPEPMPDRPTV